MSRSFVIAIGSGFVGAIQSSLPNSLPEVLCFNAPNALITLPK